MRRPDLPYTMRLADGRTVYVEVPGRWVDVDRSGEAAFTPEGARFLDHIRALASPLTQAPSPAHITTLREALGLTQAELGARLGVDKMTVSRWERGSVRPGADSIRKLDALLAESRVGGVVLTG